MVTPSSSNLWTKSGYLQPIEAFSQPRSLGRMCRVSKHLFETAIPEVVSLEIHPRLKGAVGAAGQGLSESSATSDAGPRRRLPAGGTRHFAGTGPSPAAMPLPDVRGRRILVRKPHCLRWWVGPFQILGRLSAR